MATRSSVNREIRGFAVVWTIITLLIGIATFFGIYLTYDGGLADELRDGVSIPQEEPPANQGC
jgi:hypothetical protein